MRVALVGLRQGRRNGYYLNAHFIPCMHVSTQCCRINVSWSTTARSGVIVCMCRLSLQTAIYLLDLRTNNSTTITNRIMGKGAGGFDFSYPKQTSHYNCNFYYFCKLVSLFFIIIVQKGLFYYNDGCVQSFSVQIQPNCDKIS